MVYDERSELDEARTEKPLDPAEESRLNKILHKRLEEVQDAEVKIDMRSDPRSPLYSNQTFETLNLKQELINAIYEMGFEQPSKIQEAALPLLLGAPPKDLVAQSQNPSVQSPQCVCLAPTFELALQIGEVAKKMIKYMPSVKVRVLVKGELPTANSLFTEQLVIGTPGKLADILLKYRLIDPKQIICFVIDEADIMLVQQGYRDVSIRIHNEIIQSNPVCQCMLFSATFTNDVFSFAETLIPDMAAITLRRTDQALPNIKQFLIKCNSREEKYKAIINLYNMLSIASSIIFCYTRSSAQWIAQQLRLTGRKVGLLHGEMTAEERADTVKAFREGTFRVLITTNVCSRGLDIKQVKLVVNYDPPVTFEADPKPDYDTYLHRIGRTGRFGKAGIAVNLADSERAIAYVKAFEQHFGYPIEDLNYNDFEKLDAIDSVT
ncbi:RNA helicase [Aphelenchoides bicaudatus]|nr:RNA helicase [Aphelenchoides bicaudatus]